MKAHGTRRAMLGRYCKSLNILCSYVLPNHMMFRLAEMMPQDTQMIMSLCTPVAPPLIKLKALDLVRVIENACNNVLLSTETVFLCLYFIITLSCAYAFVD